MYRKYVVCETFEGTGDFQAEKQQAGVGGWGGGGVVKSLLSNP